MGVSCQQRALALLPVTASVTTWGCVSFSDGMEVDIAPVVAGQFEDAEVDH